MSGRRITAYRHGIGELLRSRSGVTAMEYGLIAASVALAFLAIVILVSDDIGGMFTTVSESVNNAAGN